MRKLSMILLCLLIFCGCQGYDSSFSKSDLPTLTSQTSTTKEISHESSSTHDACSPVLFFDKTKGMNRAYVLGVYDGDGWHSPEDYRYNGEQIHTYVGAETTFVTSDVLDPSKSFVFYDCFGNSIETPIEGLTCTGAGRVIDDSVEVCAALTVKAEKIEGHRLGVYSTSGIAMNAMTRMQNSVVTDLNGNGIQDQIQWTFQKADISTDDEYVFYTIAIELDERTMTLENVNVLPIKQSDLEVFVLDLNADKQCEIIIYERAMSRFGTVSIYELNGDDYQMLTQYVIDPQP